VRAIVLNPKYMGAQAYGRYHKVERLRSVDNPAAGHVTRQVPSGPDEVVTVPGLVDAIVSEQTWRAAQPEKCPSRPGPRPDRPTRGQDRIGPATTSRYALRGLLVCAECGRKMQGNIIGRKVSPRVGYRCVYRDEYPADNGHPRSIFVAESRIIPVLDEWLAELSSKNVDQAVAAMLEQGAVDDSDPPEVRRARMVAKEAQTKLDRYLDAVEKGMDPSLYVERSRAAQGDLAAAKAVIEAYGASGDFTLGEDQLRDLLCRAGGITGLLQEAEPDERREFYQELGLNLVYQRVGEREKVTASLAVEFLRVGGGTFPSATRETSFDLAA
jgi:site-specific DNA recombinase